MTKTRFAIGILFCMLTAASSVINVPFAAAERAIGTSYFENYTVTVPPYYPPGNPNGLINPRYDGSNSGGGYLMPSWNGTESNRINNDWSDGSGAIGYIALGITQGEATSNAPAQNKKRKEALLRFLEDKNRNGTAWEKMGSAVVVNQMTGEKWGEGDGRQISDAKFADLRNRLVENDSIIMTMSTFDKRYNTAGVFVNGNGTYDAIQYDYGYSEFKDAWVFSDSTGNIVHALEIGCANPLGNLGGLPAAPPPEYTLRPSVTVNKSVVEPGDSLSVANQVSNGGKDPSAPTVWRLTRMQFQPGSIVADRAARDSGSDPCGAFTSAGRTECVTEQNRDSETFGANSTKVFNPAYGYNVRANMAIGTRLCFTVSVSRPTQNPSPVWRHSSLQCVIVAKKPKMQVWGGDVRVGDNIDTSTSTLGSPARTYGSWGEYGVLSGEYGKLPNGSNSGFASGAWLNRGNPNSQQRGWSDLTFANSNSSCTFGCYGFTSSAPSLTSQFTSLASDPLLAGRQNLSGVRSDTYRARNLTITGGAIGPGTTIIIVASGTVTIEGNITYSDGPYANISDIPQVVIRAGAITIANAVSTVDAWLIASNPSGTGTITTCSDRVARNDDRLTSAICNNPLRVNGPVVTDRLNLRRTAGSAGGGSLGDPAEVFNLRADAYLWASAYGSGEGMIRTVYTKELPPRF